MRPIQTLVTLMSTVAFGSVSAVCVFWTPFPFGFVGFFATLFGCFWHRCLWTRSLTNGDSLSAALSCLRREFVCSFFIEVPYSDSVNDNVMIEYLVFYCRWLLWAPPPFLGCLLILRQKFVSPLSTWPLAMSFDNRCLLTPQFLSEVVALVYRDSLYWFLPFGCGPIWWKL